MSAQAVFPVSLLSLNTCDLICGCVVATAAAALGFCPQTDPLLGLLTALEHLRLFCRLKVPQPPSLLYRYKCVYKCVIFTSITSKFLA